MCGRYSFTKEERDDISEQEINELLSELDKKYPKYPVPHEVFPATVAPVLIARPNNGTELTLMKWGFRERLNDYKDGKIVKSFDKDIFNTRIESVRKVPYWFEAIKNNRCLIPANRWFEWMINSENKSKIKYSFGVHEMQIFYFAGIWRESVDKSTGELLFEFSIIMTEANSLVREYHDKGRMPSVLIDQNDLDLWLDHSASLDRAIELAKRTFPQELMWARIAV